MIYRHFIQAAEPQRGVVVSAVQARLAFILDASSTQNMQTGGPGVALSARGVDRAVLKWGGVWGWFGGFRREIWVMQADDPPSFLRLAWRRR